LGTPEYISPEQATGGKLDARTDVYAFGILAYRMLSGHHPFPGPTARDFMLQHISAEPPQLVIDGLPRLESLVMACLNKAPKDRPDGGKALVQALEGIDTSLAPTSPELTGAQRRTGSTAVQRTPRGGKVAPTQGTTLLGRNGALDCV